MWACHNDREEDQLRSPRESRVTVTHRFRVVKATACTAAHAPRDSIRTPRIAHPFDAVQGENGGGDEGTRTPDPLLAKEVLSQLSYIPIRTVIVANRDRIAMGVALTAIHATVTLAG